MGWHGPTDSCGGCCPVCDWYDTASTPTEVSGDWGSPSTFSGTQTTADNNAILIAATGPLGDYPTRLSADIRTTDSGLVFDYLDSSNYHILRRVFVSSTSHTVTIEKITAGTPTVVYTYSTSASVDKFSGSGVLGSYSVIQRRNSLFLSQTRGDFALNVADSTFGPLSLHGGKKVGLFTGSAGGSFTNVDAKRYESYIYNDTVQVSTPVPTTSPDCVKFFLFCDPLINILVGTSGTTNYTAELGTWLDDSGCGGCTAFNGDKTHVASNPDCWPSTTVAGTGCSDRYYTYLRPRYNLNNDKIYFVLYWHYGPAGGVLDTSVVPTGIDPLYTHDAYVLEYLSGEFDPDDFKTQTDFTMTFNRYLRNIDPGKCPATFPNTFNLGVS